MDVIVHWCSCRQSLSSTATHEAELNGAVTGVKLGISLRNIVQELLEHPVTMKLDQDNQGTIRSIIYEVTPWRTRHYASRASWIRDSIQEEGIQVEHVPGVDIIADPLTKVLPKIKLIKSWEKLHLSKSWGNMGLWLPQTRRSVTSTSCQSISKVWCMMNV